MNRAAKYARAYSLGMQNGLEYRADFYLNMLSVVFQIFIQLFLWSAIYGKSGNSQLFGYTHAQMIHYTVLSALLNRLLRTGFEYEIAEDIKSGGLSKYIVRPIHYFPYRLLAFLGVKTAHTGMISIVFLLVSLLMARWTGLPISPVQILAFLPVFIFSFFLNFVLFYLVSCIAFWLAEIGFLFEAVRIVFIALSGGIFPLAVLGTKTEAILNLMPFRYTINFPVDVLNGRISGSAYWTGLMAQLVWIIVLSTAAAWVWRVGSRKFVAVGG
jgi:ABC-2 type transport system permease protein